MHKNFYRGKCCSQMTGFNLLELMVTLAVLGVVVAIAIPNFSSTSLSSRGRAITLDLQTALSLARQEAIKSHSTTTLCAVNATQNGCATAGTSNWTSGWIITRQDGTNPVVVRAWQPTNVSLLSVTAVDDSQFTFSSSGRASAGGRFEVAVGRAADNGYYQRCIEFSLIGQSFVSEGACQ